LKLVHDIKAIHNPTNKQLTAIVDRRTKLLCQIKRFRALQLGYMPVSLQTLATLPPSKSQANSEELPLYLPSSLTPSQRSLTLCRAELVSMETRLRDAQLDESLNQLRLALLVKKRLYRYKKTNARHQGATTRSRNLINRQDSKIKLAAATYRMAWRAKLSLMNGNAALVGWNELLDEDIIGMEDLQDSERRKVNAIKGKRKEAAERLLVGQDPVQGAREKNREVSWIWRSTSQGELQADKMLYEGKPSPPSQLSIFSFHLTITFAKAYHVFPMASYHCF
jgi:hypothetical protein